LITEGEFTHGYLIGPTLIDGLRTSHPLFSEELFVPITVIGDVATLDEAIDLANRSEYGLTAGIFSEDDREIEEFFDRVQAGVTYVNRRAGATTGAWPGINSFGGWKARALLAAAPVGPTTFSSHEGTEPGEFGDNLNCIEDFIEDLASD
jgi:1-pyrroline-5-carboxylate dehydrogenase